MVVEDNEDSDSVNNDDLPSSSKRAKITESTQEFAEDRVSALPDALLLHILSSVCTKQAAQTSVLSKRWQFLWTESPVLDLRDSSREIKVNRSFVDCVGRILDMCNGTNLNKLSVDFRFKKSFTSTVNIWVEFAVKNKVKDLTLHCRSSSARDVYVLPQILYSNVSLTTMAICGCAIVPQRAIEWGSLKSLSIQCMRLEESVIQKISSGCPVLEVLRLSECWGTRGFEISSSSITTLVIDGWRKPPKRFFFVQIGAPYIRVLSVSGDMSLRLHLGRISSLVSAKVDFRLPEDSASPARVDFSLTPNTNSVLLLESLRSVKELEVGPLCIAVLASVEEETWKFSPSTRLCLTLTAWRHKRTIYGILKFLESSLNLETLVIRWTSFQRHLIFVSRDQAAARSQNDKLDLVLPLLCHLKNVNISGFSETGLAGKSMLKLVELLLSTAPSLEKMVISAEDLTGYSSTRCSSTDLTKIALKLLSFPRASPEAVIMVR